MSNTAALTRWLKAWRSVPALVIGVVVLATTYWRHNVEAPLTASGVLAVYGTDAAGLLAIPTIAALLVRTPERRTKVLGRTLVALLVFLVYCAVVSASRWFSGESDVSSLLIPRANLMSAWVVLLIIAADIPHRFLLVCASTFSAILSVAALITSWTWSAWTFDYWQNNSIRTDLLTMLLPVNALAVVVLHRSRWRWLVRASFAINLFAAMFCMVVGGSRLGSLLLPAAVAVCLAAVARKIGPAAALAYVLCLVAALPALLLARDCSTPVQYGISRTPIFGSLLDHDPPQGLRFCGVDGAQPASSAADPRQARGQTAPSEAEHQGKRPEEPKALPPVGARIQPAVFGTDPSPTPVVPAQPKPTPSPPDGDESKRDSAYARQVIWGKSLGDIRRSPVFGPGYRQYQITYSSEPGSAPVTVPPHNFLLEIMLAYGVVGLLLWLAIWVAPLRAAARALGIFSTPVVLCGTSLGVVAATAFFQPLMVNPTILFCCYFVAGVLVSASRERGVGDRLGRHRVSRRGGLRMRPRLAGRSAG